MGLLKLYYIGSALRRCNTERMGHGLRVSFKIEKCRWPATAKLDEMVHMLGMGMVPGYTAFFFFFFFF